MFLRKGFRFSGFLFYDGDQCGEGDCRHRRESGEYGIYRSADACGGCAGRSGGGGLAERVCGARQMGAADRVCDGDAGGHSLHCFRIVWDGVFRHHAGNGLFDPDRGADAVFDDTAVDHAQYAGGVAGGAGKLSERSHRHGSHQMAYDPHDPAAFGHAGYCDGGVGAINESDVSLASASSAIIIGFNVRPDTTAKAVAEQEGVDVRLYKVIYQAIEDIEAAMKGMLDPIFEEKVIGHAEVRQIFKASAIGNIAGSYVLDGEFQRGCKIRITREGEQIYEGALASLKRFKDDVKEVKAGFECGLVFDGFDKMQELDIVEAYVMVEVPR